MLSSSVLIVLLVYPTIYSLLLMLRVSPLPFHLLLCYTNLRMYIVLPSRGGPYSAVNSPNQYFSAMLEILRQQRALSDGLISSRRHQHCTNAVIEITRLRKVRMPTRYFHSSNFPADALQSLVLAYYAVPPTEYH